MEISLVYIRLGTVKIKDRPWKIVAEIYGMNKMGSVIMRIFGLTKAIFQG